MRAALFIPCYVDQINPEVGLSVVRVLRRLGVEVIYPEGQTCCGQPAFNSGFFDEARELGRRFLDVFEGEPQVHPGLLRVPNVVLTPHIASATVATRRAMANLAADNLIAALAVPRGVPPTPVNPEVLGAPGAAAPQ